MADLNLADLLPKAITAYGPAVLGSALLLGGAGVPMAAMLLALAAEALGLWGGGGRLGGCSMRTRLRHGHSGGHDGQSGL